MNKEDAKYILNYIEWIQEYIKDVPEHKREALYNEHCNSFNLLQDLANGDEKSSSNCNIPLVNICTCGTEKYSEDKKRKDNLFYCKKCKLPY